MFLPVAVAIALAQAPTPGVYQRPDQPWCGSTNAAKKARDAAMKKAPLGADGTPLSPEVQLETAIAKHPDVITNYLDLAWCHAVANPVSIEKLDALIPQALTVLRTESNPAPAISGAPGDIAPSKSAEGSVAIRTKFVQPDYPDSARENGLRGVVIVEAIIDARGKVRDARVVGSVPAFDRAALKAVREWEYQPVVVDGQPTESTRLAYVRFGPGESGPADAIEIARFNYARGQYADAAAALEEASRMVARSGAVEVIAVIGPSGGAPPVGLVPPRRILDVPSAYPAIARAAKLQGDVILEFTVERNGTVDAIAVVKSIPMLDSAAIDAARQWKFSPALVNGQPVAVRVRTTIPYRL